MIMDLASRLPTSGSLAAMLVEVKYVRNISTEVTFRLVTNMTGKARGAIHDILYGGNSHND